MTTTAEPADGRRASTSTPALPPFRVWLRRNGGEPGSCAVRFEVDAGKGVLRVSRPGVLIVPPARSHGFEDRLTPAQLRQSQFLHIPGAGRARVTYGFDRLDDEQLLGLEPEVWVELSPGSDGAAPRLDLPEDAEVLALAGDGLALPDGADAPLPRSLVDVAGIVEVVSAPQGRAGYRQDDLLDEVIEADPESVDGALPMSSAAPAPSQDEDVADAPSLPPQPLPTSPPVHEAQPPGIVLALPPPSEEADAPVDEAPLGGDRHLVRHLRRELERRRVEALELRAQIERLQARLVDLGEDPAAVGAPSLPAPHSR